MKKSFVMCFTALAASILLASCATTAKKDAFPGMYDQKPEVLLIMPPVNNSNNVEAKDYFYTTMNVPLAEAGYYVLPPAAVYSTLQRESAYDAERFIEGDLKKFRQMFGADVAVFTVIKSWEKSLIGASIVIEIEYIFRSTKTNETLYHRDAVITCDTAAARSSSGLLGAIAMITANVIKTAVSEYYDVAVSCNNVALQDLPAGKYSPKFGADGEEKALAEKVSIKTSK